MGQFSHHEASHESKPQGLSQQLSQLLDEFEVKALVATSNMHDSGPSLERYTASKAFSQEARSRESYPTFSAHDVA